MPTLDAAAQSPAPARARAAGTLDQLVEVETPEQVVFSYTVAGVGSRAAAALIDLAVVAVVWIVVYTLAALAMPGPGLGGSKEAAAVLVVVQFVLMWGYYVLFEALADGQTPGKRRMGLRVVRDGGYSVTFGASAARNIVRIVDMQPGIAYFVAMVSAAVSKSGKRLGDLAAGTMVVQERVETAPVKPLDAVPPVAAPAGAAAPLQARLTDDEFALLDRYMDRRHSLEPERRAGLAAQVAAQLRTRVTDPAYAARADAHFLASLHEEERQARARGVAARSDTGARREQHAIVASGSPRWAEFSLVLARAQRRGLSAMTEAEVSDFVARYRELTADLARLRTAARGRELDALFQLSRLVAGGHNLFYRRADLAFSTAWRFVARDVPREIRRSWRPILLAAALLFLPAAGTASLIVARPELAPRFMSPAMIDRAESARARERQGEGYLPAEAARLRGPLLASLITTNNIQVTFMAFALGITAGVGTVLSLVFNGVFAMGAPLGLFISLGVGHLIWDFVYAHSALELSAICIAGGAGLLVGSAILLPGALTRKEALVLRGRRALTLVTASTLFLVVAGVIEGNVSPRPWPSEWKAFVGLVTALLIALYVTRGRAPDGETGAVETR